MASVVLEFAHKCAMPSARIFSNKRNKDMSLVSNEQDKGLSSVTAIGVPACSALELSPIKLNKPLRPIRKSDV